MLTATPSQLRRAVVALAIASLAAQAAPARAGEGLFSRAYTTDTTPGGHWELEQAVRNRTGRASGSYSAFDGITEAEYGVTDALQMALYFKTGYIDAHHAPDDDDPLGDTGAGGGFSRQKGFVQGVSAEFIYRILSPIKDPIGLAFYMEPEFDFTDLHNGLAYRGTFESEYRIIVQKNARDDRWVTAANLGIETEFIRFAGESSWAGELDWNNELGSTYRFFPNWFFGLEARNHNELGDFVHHEHSVYWAGPAAHYGGPHWWGTLGVLRQVYGDPSGTDANGTFIGDHLFLRSHEKWEITSKVGFPF